MNTGRASLRLALAGLLALAGTALGAQPAAEVLAGDLREEVHRVAVTVKDLYGREERGSIVVTLFRPPGPGPFVPVLMSHGRNDETRAALPRQRYESLARYFAAKGLALVVPTRVGYGAGAGSFDPEDSGPCNAKRYGPMAQAASDQVLAALAFVRTLPGIEPLRWLAIGQSVGGLATLAVAGRAPPGLLAAINVSGGAGGNPVARPGAPCRPGEIARLWRGQAATASAPTLWIYWTHDRYWGEEIPRQWAHAWRQGGGQVEFVQLPPWTDEPMDGHLGLASAGSQWMPVLDLHLARWLPADGSARVHASGVPPGGVKD